MEYGKNPTTAFEVPYTLFAQDPNFNDQQFWGRMSEVTEEDYQTAPRDWQLQAQQRGLYNPIPSQNSSDSQGIGFKSPQGFSSNPVSKLGNMGVGGLLLGLILLIFFLIQPAYSGAKQTRAAIVLGAFNGTEVIG